MSFAKYLCLWCFLCLLPLLITAQTNKNITLGESITAGNGSSTWTSSPSGDYAFGFLEVGTGAFLLAIWFDKIPEKTVTWSANGDALAQPGSVVQLGSNGGLVLNDPEGNIVWNTTEDGAAYAALLNTGNFVLVDGSSFLKDQIDPAQDLYQRAILEFDGVFRKYVYPKSSSTNKAKNWTIVDYEPQNICKQMSVSVGGGACGFNSYCQMEDQRPKCNCPPRYSFVDPTDTLKGCNPDFNLQSCYNPENTQDNGQFQLEVMLNTDFPGLDYEMYKPATESYCRDACLSDCNCAAAVFRDQQCWKKRFPLSNGQYFDSRTTFIKVRNGNSTDPLGGGKKERRQQTIIIIESVVLGGSVFLLLALAVTTAIFCTYKRNEKPHERRDISGTNLRYFSYRQLEEATNGFREVVGMGAFATVYKGVLDSEGGHVVAVKKLNALAQDSQKEFESEVRAIARTGHRNLVQLIGFCNEEQHRLLVYEYMPNGSLADILFKGERPNWFRRIMFAFETARGLSYLHEECSLQIIHCDIKPQNVLLDGSFTAKISDFGLAKLMKKDQSHTQTAIRGTKGYVAPEWFKTVPITTKVDVYSYGILLLELVCCRRSFDANLEDERQMALADWAYDCYKEGRIDKLVKNDHEALTDIENVKTLVKIALCCIQDDPSCRPSMYEVSNMIRGEPKEFPPLDLASFVSSSSEGSAI